MHLSSPRTKYCKRHSEFSLPPSLKLFPNWISSLDWRVLPMRVSPGGFASRQTRPPFTPEFGSLVPESPSSRFPAEVEMAYKGPRALEKTGCQDRGGSSAGGLENCIQFLGRIHSCAPTRPAESVFVPIHALLWKFEHWHSYPWPLGHPSYRPNPFHVEEWMGAGSQLICSRRLSRRKFTNEWTLNYMRKQNLDKLPHVLWSLETDVFEICYSVLVFNSIGSHSDFWKRPSLRSRNWHEAKIPASSSVAFYAGSQSLLRSALCVRLWNLCKLHCHTI